MSTLESAIKRTWEDVDKLGHQIEAILKALKENGEIVQVESNLVSILDSAAKKVQPLKKTKLLPDSDDEDQVYQDAVLKDKDVQLKKSSTSRDASETKLTQLRQGVEKIKFFDDPACIYVASHADTFLIPLIDRWVWGTTITNDSRSDATLPELYLSIPPLYLRSGTPFSYACSLTIVDAVNSGKEEEGMQKPLFSRHYAIPYQKLLLCNQEEEKLTGKAIMVPSGYKVWVTAWFTNPVNQIASNQQDKVTVMASLLCNRIHQWSKLIEFKRVHAATLYNDALFKKHQPQIFTALAPYQDTFKLERLLSQADKTPVKSLDKFLSSLGFENIYTDKAQAHLESQWYTSSKMSLLYGFMAKVEKNAADSSSAHCLVCARSDDQMHLFVKLLSDWLKRENYIDKKKGSRGMSLSTLAPKSADDLAGLLFEEIEIMSHLVLLNHKDLTSLEAVSVEWLRRHINATLRTDLVFKQYMKTA